MSNESVVSLFDDWAQSGLGDGMEQTHGDVVDQVISRMEMRPGMQSLDLGCGTGWATRRLASAAPGAGAVGIDASKAMIARAEELHDLTSRARYETGSFEKIDFPDGRFDRVFSMEALYYASDVQQALAEVFRVTKAGGHCDIVVDRFKESPHTECWAEAAGVPMQFLGESEWVELLSAAGFEEVSTSRLVDSRGPGEQAEFEASPYTPSWQAKVERMAAGSLWLQGTKPDQG